MLKVVNSFIWIINYEKRHQNRIDLVVFFLQHKQTSLKNNHSSTTVNYSEKTSIKLHYYLSDLSIKISVETASYNYN